MKPIRLAALVVAALLVLVLVVAGSGLAATVLFGFSVEGQSSLSFGATSPECDTGETPLFATAFDSLGSEPTLTITADMTLPSPGYTLDADLERVSDGVYALHVTSDATGQPAAQCVATTRYTATVTGPATADGTVVIVYHDGEEIGRASN